MTFQLRCVAFILALPLLGLGLGCGGGGKAATPGPGRNASLAQTSSGSLPGTLALTLVNEGAAGGFQEVHLSLAAVDIRKRDGAWVSLPLATRGQRVELLNLQGREIQPITEAVALPTGTYDQVRIRLGSGHSLKLQGGEPERSLTAPESITATSLALEVQGGAKVDAVFTFRTAYAIRETPPKSGHFALQPFPSNCVDRRGTRSISGRLTWGSGGDPVAGVTVTAQHGGFFHRKVEKQRLLRTATTRADGTYTLDLLPPFGGHHPFTPYAVVVPPGLGPEAHGLTVGPRLSVESKFCDLALRPLEPNPGSVAVEPGSPFPAEDDGAEVLLLRYLPASDAWPAFPVIVGAQRRVWNEPAVFQAIRAGNYTVLERPSAGATGAGDPAGTAERIWTVTVSAGAQSVVRP